MSRFPLSWLNSRPPCPASGNDKGLTSSCRFSPHMPRPWTPTAPRNSHPIDFSVLACVALKTSPTAFLFITVLTWLQGCANPLWPMWFSVYASLVLLCSRVPQPKPPATFRRTRNTRYGWLVRPYEIQSLDFSRSGLTPEKKRQASLVALTPNSAARGTSVGWSALFGDFN